MVNSLHGSWKASGVRATSLTCKSKIYNAKSIGEEHSTVVGHMLLYATSPGLNFWHPQVRLGRTTHLKTWRVTASQYKPMVLNHFWVMDPCCQETWTPIMNHHLHHLHPHSHHHPVPFFSCLSPCSYADLPQVVFIWHPLLCRPTHSLLLGLAGQHCGGHIGNR